MIETLTPEVLQELQRLPLFDRQNWWYRRCRVVNAVLKSGAKRPVVFVNCDDLVGESAGDGELCQTASFGVDLPARQRVFSARIPASHVVRVLRTSNAVPDDLQSQLRELGELPWSGFISFGVKLRDGEVLRAVALKGDPYYCVSLPDGRDSSEIVAVVPSPVDAATCGQISPGVCVYR